MKEKEFTKYAGKIQKPFQIKMQLKKTVTHQFSKTYSLKRIFSKVKLTFLISFRYFSGKITQKRVKISLIDFI